MEGIVGFGHDGIFLTLCHSHWFTMTTFNRANTWTLHLPILYTNVMVRCPTCPQRLLQSARIGTQYGSLDSLSWLLPNTEGLCIIDIYAVKFNSMQFEKYLTILTTTKKNARKCSLAYCNGRLCCDATSSALIIQCNRHCWGEC